jgi:UDP-N-acetylglucosamine 2-epimerase (non-hydrolysing)
VKIVIAYGTRPEAIKLAPLILSLKSRPSVFETVVVVTGQHRELLDQVQKFFRIAPDYDLNLMRPDQTLFDISIACLAGMREVLSTERPDLLIVQGDTTTAFVAALSAVYLKIPVAHIEAGLRTHCKSAPFPEEINRVLIARLADIHFAPSATARENLLKEGIEDNRIAVTGNTGIDTLSFVSDRLHNPQVRRTVNRHLRRIVPEMTPSGIATDLILVTVHRRENFGDGLKQICKAIKKIAETRRDVTIVFCLHPNPNAHDPARKILGNVEAVRLVDPMDYATFVSLMEKARMIMTDSGGVQEEAVYLGKRVLMLREKTERGDLLDTGFGQLVGLDADKIVQAALRHFGQEISSTVIDRNTYPYGDGCATERIVRFLEKRFGKVLTGLCGP